MTSYDCVIWNSWAENGEEYLSLLRAYSIYSNYTISISNNPMIIRNGKQMKPCNTTIRNVYAYRKHIID